jgi:hypothetical protein
VIEFADLNRKVAPDSLAKYFEAPTTNKFAFYRHPESSAVVLIWTRFPAATSVKTTRVQARLRRELTWYAEREGIKTVIAASLKPSMKWRGLTLYSIKSILKRTRLVRACRKQSLRHKNPESLKLDEVFQPDLCTLSLKLEISAFTSLCHFSVESSTAQMSLRIG